MSYDILGSEFDLNWDEDNFGWRDFYVFSISLHNTHISNCIISVVPAFTGINHLPKFGYTCLSTSTDY